VGDTEIGLLCEQPTIFAKIEIEYLKKIFQCFMTRIFFMCQEIFSAGARPGEMFKVVMSNCFMK
jgi:hypothetical protein